MVRQVWGLGGLHMSAIASGQGPHPVPGGDHQDGGGAVCGPFLPGVPSLLPRSSDRWLLGRAILGISGGGRGQVRYGPPADGRSSSVRVLVITPACNKGHRLNGARGARRMTDHRLKVLLGPKC